MPRRSRGPDPGQQHLDRAVTLALVTDELGRMARIVDDLRLLADAGESDFVQPELIELPALREELLLKARARGTDYGLPKAPRTAPATPICCASASTAG